MRRNKIVVIALAAAALVVSACASPVAPTAPKGDGCGVTNGSQTCLK